MGRSRSATISPAGPSTGIWIARWKRTANGRKWKRATLCGRWRCFGSSWWSVMVQEAKLKSLEEENKQMGKNLRLVAASDTSAAFDFHNQLATTQLLLQIETGDAASRIDRLHEYL